MAQNTSHDFLSIPHFQSLDKSMTYMYQLKGKERADRLYHLDLQDKNVFDKN